MSLFALSEFFSAEWQDRLKMAFSTASLVVTMYFWIMRANRERVSVRVYSVSCFEGTLEANGVSLWTGRLFLANRSIMPTAIVGGKVEVCWNGRRVAGRVIAPEGSEFPWNLAPSQVYSKAVLAAFDLGPDTPREQVYENQRLRFTFVTVEGNRVSTEIDTNVITDVAA